MADASTLSFLDTVGGYLSLVVSVVALGFGVAGYRKATSVKRLDLRLEYRRKKAGVDFATSRCSDLLPKVKKSRLASFSADGLLGSGQKIAFEQTWEEWSNLVQQKLLGSNEVELDNLTENELEKLLGDLAIEELKVCALLKELEDVLAIDAKNVERRVKAHSK